MAANPKVCHYLDIPLQHADKSVLRGMHRPGDRETFENLIKKIRKKVPDMVIRTTVMTGFPGETDEQFEELAEFVKAMKFDNLGCFAFSPEEGTVAAEREDQIDEEVKAIVDRAYSRCESILTEKRRELELTARYLLEHETMDGAVFEKVFTQPDGEEFSGLMDEA